MSYVETIYIITRDQLDLFPHMAQKIYSGLNPYRIQPTSTIIEDAFKVLVHHMNCTRLTEDYFIVTLFSFTKEIGGHWWDQVLCGSNPLRGDAYRNEKYF